MNLVVTLHMHEYSCKEIKPHEKQPTPGHVAVLTNQMLVYKHRRVIPRVVIPRIESVAEMPKLKPRINLGICKIVYKTPESQHHARNSYHPNLLMDWHDALVGISPRMTQPIPTNCHFSYPELILRIMPG